MPNTAYTNTVNTGCLGGQAPSAEPLHGAELVRSVLQGFTYPPGTAQRDARETQLDRSRDIRSDVNRLAEDIEALMAKVAQYETDYGPMSDRSRQTLEQLSLRLSTPARTAREQTRYQTGVAWHEKMHYGHERQDHC